MSVINSRVGLEVHNEKLPLKAPFRISGYIFHDSPALLYVAVVFHLVGYSAKY